MDFKEMIGKLEETHGCLQNLDVRPSRENVMLLANCMVQLEDVMAALNEKDRLTGEQAVAGASGEEE